MATVPLTGAPTNGGPIIATVTVADAAGNTTNSACQFWLPGSAGLAIATVSIGSKRAAARRVPPHKLMRFRSRMDAERLLALFHNLLVTVWTMSGLDDGSVRGRAEAGFHARSP